ncbi:hypothetical protein EYF80_034080 [Liparis tanakae]|uniref:Uncharacterized protein n=1 Tax=Liparis tanakae TaxID=230148 RepID=A0A4Z2GRH3_9TELE|nr:hypothetical protein EYF80_034080 [Liparis tanakae]
MFSRMSRSSSRIRGSFRRRRIVTMSRTITEETGGRKQECRAGASEISLRGTHISLPSSSSSSSSSSTWSRCCRRPKRKRRPRETAFKRHSAPSNKGGRCHGGEAAEMDGRPSVGYSDFFICGGSSGAALALLDTLKTGRRTLPMKIAPLHFKS